VNALPRALAALLFSATAAAQSVRVEGRVVDVRGEPVPAASVWLTDIAEGAPARERANADGDGCFLFAHAPVRSAWCVCATAPGCCTAFAVVQDENPVPAVVLREAVTVRGVLRDRAGRPVATAVVEAVGDRELEARTLPVRAITAADGTFALAGAPLGPLAVGAVVPGEGLAWQRVTAHGDCEVELAPWSGKTTSIEIRIADLPPAAVAAARVELVPYGNQAIDWLPSPWRRLACDAKGRVLLPDAPDLDYLVRADAPGCVVNPRASGLYRSHGPHRVELRAEASGVGVRTATGTLHSASDEPIAGVRLRVDVAGDVIEVTTDGNGVFQFAHQRTSPTTCLFVLLDDRWVLDNFDPAFTPDRPIYLRAVAPCEVAGALRLADGRPASLVEIDIEAETRDGTWLRHARGRTDRDGRLQVLRLRETPRALRLAVAGRHGTFLGEPFALPAPGTKVDLGTSTLRAAVVIEGVVCDAAQRPVAGQGVWLLTTDPRRPVLHPPDPHVEALTDREGRYRFVGVAPGPAWLQLRRDGWPAVGVTVDRFTAEPGERCTRDLAVR
jgi:hypothetical protein